jgi:undecaprenyl-diphosphatase
VSFAKNVQSRLAENLRPVARRVRTASAAQPPPAWGRFAATILVGLGLVVLVGAFIDAPVMAWTATLPDNVRAFFSAATRFGRSDWLLIPTGIIAIAVAFGDWRRVSRPVAAAWWEVATFAALLFVVVAATGLTTDLFKPIVGRLRPEYAGDSVFTFNPFTLGGYRNYSFPSGHATTMGAVAVFAAFAPGVLTMPIIALSAVVAVSRVMIGVHYPSDVVGGALIGVGLGYLILRGMADAGIVFVVRENGKIGRRFGVVRRLRRRRAGLRAMLRGLWMAWVGRST